MRLLICLALLMQTAAPPAFEVASVKQVSFEVFRQRKSGVGCGMPSPGRVSCMGSVRMLLAQAYDVPLARSSQDIVGLPDWADDDIYAIEAVVSTGDPAMLSPESVYAMVRTLFAERFKLIAHHERKEVAGYALVMARGDGKPGPRLQPTPKACADWIVSRTKGEPPVVFGDLPCGRGQMGGSVMRQTRVPISQLANLLSARVERPVENRTGLAGMYAFDLRWAAPMPANPSIDALPSPPPSDDLPASIFTALQEQLGLKLEPSRTMGEFLVVDRIDRPTPN
ncbi:MAG TPA: TIGR03435 family protein [Vicinamibacterales bacterium]